MNKTRVLISCIHRLFRESLAHAIGKEIGIEIIEKTDPSLGEIETALSLKPDIIIMDTCISGLNRIEAIRQIISQIPDSRIIALSKTAIPHDISRMINLGVKGYLLKSSPVKELIQAIHSVTVGKIHLSPEMAGLLVKTISARTPNHDLVSPLSCREREVLQLIAEGYRPKGIAKKLYISPKTVQIHQSNLKKKLNITTTAGLTKYAVSKGITPLDFIVNHPL